MMLQRVTYCCSNNTLLTKTISKICVPYDTTAQNQLLIQFISLKTELLNSLRSNHKIKCEKCIGRETNTASQSIVK